MNLLQKHREFSGCFFPGIGLVLGKEENILNLLHKF
jgi:hypothetical protein